MDRHVPEYHGSRPGESPINQAGEAAKTSDNLSTHPKSILPSIRVQGRQVVTSLGSPTTLLTSIESGPAPTVRWLHNGTVCEEKDGEGNKYRIVNQPPFFCLFIEATCAEDAGEYLVVARNEGGESISLSVLEPAPPEKDSKHTDIPLDEFPSVVSRLRNQSLLMEEFYSVELPWKVSQHTGNLACNMHKNRYYNVLPYDHSRVVLPLQTNVPGSDYINACHMEEDYIACQGPLPDTFVDFWQMVWVYNVHVIAMVTKITDEHSIHMKCHRYWPKVKTESMKHGNFLLTLKDIQTFPYCEVRTLDLIDESQPTDTPPREVKHLQFLSWPEYGVPKKATDLIDFRNKVRICHSKVTGPLLTHCSAGVGRTGTFMCIDMLLKRLENKCTSLDVFNLVRKLRHRRERTVETPEQYTLIHEALLEVLKNQ